MPPDFPTNDVRERMQDTARAIESILPPGTGFVLLAFDFKPDGRMEYISNGEREDVLKTMQEFIENNQRPDNFGKHV